jgi:type IV pilus assembly protein PilE
VRRPSPRGFTVIELLIVVSILGFLAIVVVPSWFKDTNKGKYDSEVSAMMSEIVAKEEQYKIENAAYLATAACPSTPSNSGAGTPVTTCEANADWAALRLTPALSNLRCSYTITVGTPGTTAAPGLTGVTFDGGPGYWFYAVAACDMDGDGVTVSSYLVGSTNTKVQRDANYGQ